MKKTIFAIVFIILSSSIFAQYKMTIKKTDNTTQVILVSEISEISFFNCGVSTVSYGGQTYNTVQIGTQCWLKENLNVGTRINGISQQTNNSIIEKYCYNNTEENCTTYGGLYQWAETVQYQNGATNTSVPSPSFSGNVKGICPEGWHIPTLIEFRTLETAVVNDGNALKAVGQGTVPGVGTNTSGFSALLAGFRRYQSGSFGDFGIYAYFWSTDEQTTNALGLDLINNSSAISCGIYAFVKQDGFSVRCLKD